MLSKYARFSGLVVLAGVAMLNMTAAAQKQQSDAQVEASVLKAFAGAPQLANESITTTTLYGAVTLSGTVSGEASRTLAETLASRTLGVQKVVDELTLGAPAQAGSGGLGETAPPPPPESDTQQGSQPVLQSDGTVAPSGGSDQNQMGEHAPDPPPAANGSQAYPAPGQAGDPSQAPQSQAYPQYPQQGSPVSPTYRQPYNGAAQQAAPPYGAQVAGRPVTIPSGALVRVRINQGLDTKHTKPGTLFDATVLNDVVADGEVAIPRGASVQGVVVDSKNSGNLGGKGELALQLNQVTLSGRTYPVISDEWTQNGRDKTGQTVGNAIGLGAFGALIGAVAGGGPGAAIGAAAGGAAGVGASAASGGARVAIPAEAILTFHLTQPAPVTTVSQAEMDRLGYGVQPAVQMQRRMPPPGYYPQPYPYAY